MKVYGKCIMSQKQEWFWHTEFNNGRTDLRDEERAWQPSMSIKDDNACHAKALIQSDCCITLSQITKEINNSISSAHNIVYEQLGCKKTCIYRYAC